LLVADVRLNVRERAEYTLDFGDSWLHEVLRCTPLGSSLS
jgi:hypothetical protein